MDNPGLSMALEVLKKFEAEGVDAGQLLITLSLFDLLATMSMLNARLGKVKTSVSPPKSGASSTEELRARAGSYDEGAMRIRELPLDMSGREGGRDERLAGGDGADEGSVVPEGRLEKEERPAGIEEMAGEGDGGKKLARRSLDWRRQWKQSAG